MFAVGDFVYVRSGHHAGFVFVVRDLDTETPNQRLYYCRELDYWFRESRLEKAAEHVI